MQSDSATSGQRLELRTDRRSDVSIGGGGPVREGAGLMMSLWSGVLVLLVYGGFILQQSQTQVTAPAPCETHKHDEAGLKNHGCRDTSSACQATL